MFAVATISSTLCTYLYLHDLCFGVCFYVFYVYMGQVPEIKLMMMMIILRQLALYNYTWTKLNFLITFPGNLHCSISPTVFFSFPVKPTFWLKPLGM